MGFEVAGGAVGVFDFGGRVVVDRQFGLLKAEAEFDVLVVEEETLV